LIAAARYFVSGSGTGVGKTVITASLAAAARAQGRRVRALKPVETGCAEGIAADALQLAAASGHPDDATRLGFHRGHLPLAPYAATLEGELPPPALDALVRSIDEASAEAELVLIEGAGGLLVPYDETLTFADLARALRAPLILVFPNELGVLHAAESTIEAARARALPLAAAILVDRQAPDLSAKTNAAILKARHPTLPIHPFPWTNDAIARRDAASDTLCILLDT
jgi:dethiobiotin synthetase